MQFLIIKTEKALLNIFYRLFLISLRFIGFCLLFFCFSCANIVTPSGGARDISPPRIINCIPPNHSVDFKEKKAVIQFDEFLVLNDLSNQLQVFPAMKNNPEIILRGKSIFIKLSDSLKPQTTYNINFGEAIADLHENNKIKGFDYVFSTGNYIDSAILVGKLFDAQQGKPEKAISVMLYTQIYDSIPYLEKPDYITKTDDGGFFVFKNLPLNKPFKIFALKDANGNQIYDLPNEKIAYNEKPLYAFFNSMAFKDTTLTTINYDFFNDTTKNNTALSFLYLFQEEDTVQKLIKCQLIANYTFALCFKKPLEKEKITLKPFENFQMPLMKFEYAKTNDSIKYWVLNSLLDSAKFTVWMDDICIDTVKLNLKSKTQKRNITAAEKNLVQISTNISNQQLDYQTPLRFYFNNPIEHIDTAKIIIKSSFDTLKFKISSFDSINRIFNVNYHWKKDSLYKILILPKAIVDEFKQANDTAKFQFKLSKESDYSGIILNLKSSNQPKSLIVQLYSSSDKLVQEKTWNNQGKLEFEKIQPGNYKLRLIVDNNNNGKWDAGRYLKKIQPEEVKNYFKEIQLKPGFITDIDWNY